MDRYPIPAGRARVEEVVLRSRFITTGSCAASVGEARAFVAEIRAEFADATHNCFAFVVGPPGSAAQAGYSDDGEPTGTAGRPMLNVLLGCGLGDIVVVVTRYFGGRKLGTGGLSRAYSGGVKALLAVLPVKQKVNRVLLKVTGPYRWITPLQRLLAEFEVEVVSHSFAGEASWLLSVPKDRAQALTSTLHEMSRGEVRVA